MKDRACSPDDGSISPSKDAGAIPKKLSPVNAILLSAERFILDVDALQEMYDDADTASKSGMQNRLEVLNRYIDSVHSSEPLKQHDYRVAHNILALATKLRRGHNLFSGHMLVAMVSRFDRFVAGVVRELLVYFPDKIAGKPVSYADATSCASIEELRDRFIDEELDTKGRESHLKQLEYLSFLREMKLGTDEPTLMAEFVEVTERRNCHIHFGGEVSPQYRRVCTANGVQFKVPPKDGEELPVTSEYFGKARCTLSEIAFKLSQSIVRKVFPDMAVVAELHVDALGIQMLNEHRWEEALMVFDYAAKLRGTWVLNEALRRNYIINKAQALKGLGKQDAALKEIASLDWSAAHSRYLLAIALIKDDFDGAAELMSEAEFSENSYRTWPIFEAFRDTTQFKTEFRKLFGKDFDQSESKTHTKPVEAAAAEREAFNSVGSTAETLLEKGEEWRRIMSDSDSTEAVADGSES